MNDKKSAKRSIGIWVFSLLALVFGLMTIKSGGAVIFFDGEARQAAGHYVPFIVWFNFIAGFIYIIAAIFLWLQNRIATSLSLFITITTLIVFSLFGLHIIDGGEYEMRTIIAMSLRSAIWVIISVYSWQYFLHTSSNISNHD
jgi:hypothetical protein